MSAGEQENAASGAGAGKGAVAVDNGVGVLYSFSNFSGVMKVDKNGASFGALQLPLPPRLRVFPSPTLFFSPQWQAYYLLWVELQVQPRLSAVVPPPL